MSLNIPLQTHQQDARLMAGCVVVSVLTPLNRECEINLMSKVVDNIKLHTHFRLPGSDSRHTEQNIQHSVLDEQVAEN